MRTFAFVGAAVTVALALVFAAVVIQDGDPMYPPDAFGTPESHCELCYRPFNPPDAPSDIEVFPVSIDQKTSERWSLRSDWSVPLSSSPLVCVSLP
jgi:hypothetical protein